MVFSDHCDQLPEGLRGIKLLAHTAVSAIALYFAQESCVVAYQVSQAMHTETRLGDCCDSSVRQCTLKQGLLTAASLNQTLLYLAVAAFLSSYFSCGFCASD